MGNSWVVGSVTGGESTFRWRSSPLFLSVIDSSDFRVQVKTLLVVISPLGQFLLVASRYFSSLLVIRRAFSRVAFRLRIRLFWPLLSRFLLQACTLLSVGISFS
jgi:hypothetical protein